MATTTAPYAATAGGGGAGPGAHQGMGMGIGIQGMMPGAMATVSGPMGMGPGVRVASGGPGPNMAPMSVPASANPTGRNMGRGKPPTPTGANQHSVKETKEVKRNKAQLPSKIQHEQPKTGDWLKKRYIVNNYILLDTLGTGSYGEVRRFCVCIRTCVHVYGAYASCCLTSLPN
jgi:hypothetical protein